MNTVILTRSDVARLTGRPSARVAFWTRERLLEASVRRAAGPGTRQLFGWPDLCRAGVIALLEECGTELEKIREIVRTVRGAYTWPGPPPAPIGPRDVWLLSDRDGIRTAQGPSFEAIVKNKPYVLGLNL